MLVSLRAGASMTTTPAASTPERSGQPTAAGCPKQQACPQRSHRKLTFGDMRVAQERVQLQGQLTEQCKV